MQELAFWLIFVLFTLVNLLFVFYKNKSDELVILHLVIFCLCLFVGATQMLEFDNLLALVFMLISGFSFFINVLMIKV